MKKLKIVLHQNAISDLDDIWLYTFHNWSKEQADRYLSLIYKEIDFLSTKPKSGKSIDYLRIGYRTSQVKSHIIFYRFSSTEIEIVRILHGSMDIPNRLEE